MNDGWRPQHNVPEGREAKLRNRIGLLLPAGLIAGIAALLIVLALTDTIAALLAIVSVLVAAVAGLSVTLVRKHSSVGEQLGLLETPFYLSHAKEVFGQYRDIAASLLRLSQNRDPIFRETAAGRLQELANQMDALAGGTIVFSGTETWRMIYETLLRSKGLYRYRSVAWIRSAGYWQDEPGRRSIELNVEILKRNGVTVERIVILADKLWPAEDLLPEERIRQWIHEQSSQGVDVRLAAESDLESEPDLMIDMGIYGNRAVGYQEVDDRSRTRRFTLHFDLERILAAEALWERLSVYAAKYEEILDRYALYE